MTIPHYKAKEVSSYVAMGAVPSPKYICDFYRVGKYPQKADYFTLASFLSVAISLCNEIEYSFLYLHTYVVDFADLVTFYNFWSFLRYHCHSL